jgi:hypothetical protein
MTPQKSYYPSMMMVTFYKEKKSEATEKMNMPISKADPHFR